MNQLILKLQQKIEQQGVSATSNQLQDWLSAKGLEPQDLSEEILDVLLEDFIADSSQKKKVAITSSVATSEKPIASTRSTGSTALATATAPQTKTAIDLATPVRSLSLAQVKETIETLEIEIDAGLTADEDEAIGYLLQLYDRAQEFEQKYAQAVEALKSHRLESKAATLQGLADFNDQLAESSRQSLEAIKTRNAARFRELDSRFSEFIDRLNRQPAS